MIKLPQNMPIHAAVVLAVLLCLTIVPMRCAEAESLWWRPAAECSNNGNGTAYACANSGGGVGAFSGASANVLWANSVTVGSVNYGDTLYICGLHPTGIAVGAIGTSGAQLIISGAAVQCGGVQGEISNPDTTVSSGHGVTWNNRQDISVEDLTFRNVFRSGVNCGQSTTPCTDVQVRRITCYLVGLDTGQGGDCATVATNTYGDAAVGASVVLEDITSYDGGGAACAVRGNFTAPILRRCKSYRDGKYKDTWGVYVRGDARNLGTGCTANRWTEIGSGNFDYKTNVTVGTGCGNFVTGLTISAIMLPNVGNPVRAVRLKKETGCITNDTICAAALDLNEWGQIGDVLYVNTGGALGTTTSVPAVIAENTDPVIEYAYVESFAATHDGTGMGCDLGCNRCIVRRSEARNNPGHGINCWVSYDCSFQANLAVDNGIGNYQILFDGEAINNTSIFTGSIGTHFFWKQSVDPGSFGIAVSAKNNTLIGGSVAVNDELNGAGIETWNYNGYKTGMTFIAATAGANDVVTSDLKVDSTGRPMATSPLLRAGTCFLATGCIYPDFRGYRSRVPPDIGAYQRTSGDP